MPPANLGGPKRGVPHMHVRSSDSLSDLPPPLRPELGLALQGGGAYGAFTWGVLDRLLEERTFRPTAISGASAGAINAAVMVSGLITGGRAAAKAGLEALWRGVGGMALFRMLGTPGVSLQLDLMTRLLSPYQFNPLNINPLRDLLGRLIDFEALACRGRRIALFFSATNVRTGAPRIFRESELSVDVLMASSCLPYLHHAVEIDGESYWDGGFSANPPILPMVLDSRCSTLLLVKLMPETEDTVPTQAQLIFARMRRLMFNAALERDLEALDIIQNRLRRTNMRLPRDLVRLRALDLRSIAMPADLLNQEGGRGGAAMIEQMRLAGREAAEAMLVSPRK
jgi:NTE family protein